MGENLQKRAWENKVAHGFNTTDVSKEFNLLYGEVAEAYDAYNKNQGNVGEELADVAIYLLGLSEMLQIDLKSEILKKMEINEKRVYVNGVKK